MIEMLEQLMGKQVTLFVWDGQARHEVHGKLLWGLAGYMGVTVGRVIIHFLPASVERVGLTGNNIWLKQEGDYD